MTHLCQKLCLVVYPDMEKNQVTSDSQKKDTDGENGKSPQTADDTCA